MKTLFHKFLAGGIQNKWKSKGRKLHNLSEIYKRFECVQRLTMFLDIKTHGDVNSKVS